MHELDGYTSRHFTLKRFAVLDRSTGRRDPIWAPDHWQDELSDRDRIWIADPAGDYRVQIKFDVMPLSNDPAAQRDDLIASVIEGFEEWSLVCPIATTRDGDGAVIEAIIDTGDGFDIFRMFRLWPREDVYFLGQLSLEFKSGSAGRPETLDLIELFQPQLLRAEAPADLPIAESLPPSRPGSRFNFRDLIEVEPYGFMEIRVPSCWQSEEDDEGHVAYFDPDEEAMTLFVNYVLILRLPYRTGGTLERQVEITAREEEDRGVRLRRIKWTISDTTHQRAMWVIVDLVIDAERADTPEFRELVGIMNDEVRRMRIGDPPASAEACAQPRRKAAVP